MSHAHEPAATLARLIDQAAAAATFRRFFEASPVAPLVRFAASDARSWAKAK